MRYLKTTLTVIGAVTVLVLAGNTVALAATGHSLLLGKSNSADTYTSLTRTTSGTVLSLKSASSTNSPLSVNGKGKVTNLNADTLDGLDSSSLQTRTKMYSLPGATDVTSYNVSFPGLAAGVYHATYSAIGSGTSMNCDFQYADNSYTVLGYGTTSGGYVVANGAGIVDTRSQTMKFHCFGSTFSVPTSEPSQITFTRVDSLTTIAATAARRAPRASSGAAR